MTTTLEQGPYHKYLYFFRAQYLSIYFEHPSRHIFFCSPLDAEALSIRSSAFAFCIFRVAHCRGGQTEDIHGHVLCGPVDGNLRGT